MKRIGVFCCAIYICFVINGCAGQEYYGPRREFVNSEEVHHEATESSEETAKTNDENVQVAEEQYPLKLEPEREERAEESYDESEEESAYRISYSHLHEAVAQPEEAARKNSQKEGSGSIANSRLLALESDAENDNAKEETKIVSTIVSNKGKVDVREERGKQSVQIVRSLLEPSEVDDASGDKEQVEGSDRIVYHFPEGSGDGNADAVASFEERPEDDRRKAEAKGTLQVDEVGSGNKRDNNEEGRDPKAEEVLSGSKQENIQVKRALKAEEVGFGSTQNNASKIEETDSSPIKRTVREDVPENKQNNSELRKALQLEEVCLDDDKENVEVQTAPNKDEKDSGSKQDNIELKESSNVEEIGIGNNEDIGTHNDTKVGNNHERIQKDEPRSNSSGGASKDDHVVLELNDHNEESKRLEQDEREKDKTHQVNETLHHNHNHNHNENETKAINIEALKAMAESVYDFLNKSKHNLDNLESVKPGNEPEENEEEGKSAGPINLDPEVEQNLDGVDKYERFKKDLKVSGEEMHEHESAESNKTSRPATETSSEEEEETEPSNSLQVRRNDSESHSVHVLKNTTGNSSSHLLSSKRFVCVSILLPILFYYLLM